MVSQIFLYTLFNAHIGKVCLLPHLGHVTGVDSAVACHSISKPMNTLWQSVQRKGILPRIIVLQFNSYHGKRRTTPNPMPFPLSGQNHRMASARVSLHLVEGWLDRLMDMTTRFYSAAKLNIFSLAAKQKKWSRRVSHRNHRNRRIQHTNASFRQSAHAPFP